MPVGGVGRLTGGDSFFTFVAIMRDSIQGVVPLSYVALLFDYLQQCGENAEALLGMPRPDVDSDKLARYPVAQWKRLLELAAQRLDNPRLGLELGQQVSTGLFGVLGYVLMACPNLGAALQRLQQYHRLVYDVNPLSLFAQGDNLVLSWGVERGRPGALVDEFAITALVQFARDITGREVALQQLSFVNPAPPDLGPYQAYFNAPVSFSQAETRLVFANAVLALPLRQPDATLLGILEAQLQEQLQALGAERSLEKQVREQLLRGCAEGEADLQHVAAALCMSSRSLRRHLAEAGLSFKTLLEETRFFLARQYLADPRLQLAEISLLLGYSSQSAFNRAFSRWTGQTPRQYRLEYHLPGDHSACWYS